MNVPISGYKEVEHTADSGLYVWAPDLSMLFIEAARGMNSLTGITLERGDRIEHSFSFDDPAVEILLVMFLEEILYCGEQDELGFDEFEVVVVEKEGFHLQAKIHGAPIAEQKREIKAVTFHNLNITETESGYEVGIVFDV